MGGYGALKWALRQPDRFAAAASLSGARRPRRRAPDGHRAGGPALMARVFDGRAAAGTADDLLHLVDGADPATLPALHVCCGTEDELLRDSRAVRRPPARPPASR